MQGYCKPLRVGVPCMIRPLRKNNNRVFVLAFKARNENPMFLEPYWMRQAAASAVVVSGWHRLSYRTTDGLFQSVELENHIRRLHRAVGNDKHLVFGAGSTQLINAMVYALSPEALTYVKMVA